MPQSWGLNSRVGNVDEGAQALYPAMPHTPIGVAYEPGFALIRKDPADGVWDLRSNWHLPAALSSLSHIP